MFETIQIDNVEELKQENAKLKEEVEMYRASDSIRKDNLEVLKEKVTALFKEFTNEE
jgi:FtsZ-binding cell division protein ZapB